MNIATTFRISLAKLKRTTLYIPNFFDRECRNAQTVWTPIFSFSACTPTSIQHTYAYRETEIGEKTDK